MKRVFLALAAALLLLLVTGVGTAAANPPASQGSGQWAGSEQGSGAAAGTAQQEPTNANSPVRVLSPGDDGSVSQSNEASSDATAGNLNATEQTADQTQAGGSGLQAIGQSATNDQDALALAFTLQEGASNENGPVRVLSPGEDGSVSQSNDASSDASAGNTNVAEQTAAQDQAGSSCCGSGGEQVIGQSADSEQDAAALSTTVQEKPSNENISVRVLSPGDDGEVSQSSEASSNATAGNLNVTKQTADQTQAGGSCKCGGAGEQVIGQSAGNDQDAAALAATKQEKPSNSNISVRVLSPGNGGSVSQSNVASSDAAAGNINLTEQTADQTQAGHSCKCGSGGLQVIGQSAASEQEAAAISATIQEKPSNSNAPVRVLSPGDDGRVSQLNEASSNATAANVNVTKQAADQLQAGGSGIQAIGQSATNAQGAFALGLTIQEGASNENAPVRVLSPGDGGSVSQSNVASSDASAGNINWTDQHADQIQGGRDSLDKHCCGTGIQVIGQSSTNHQGAVALAATLQLGLEPPCKCKDKSQIGNTNEPTRVLSPGDDGAVRQANVATSHATAANWHAAVQAASQIQPTRCMCLNPDGVQAIGQLSDSRQFAVGLAASLQLDDGSLLTEGPAIVQYLADRSPTPLGPRHWIGGAAVLEDWWAGGRPRGAATRASAPRVGRDRDSSPLPGCSRWRARRGVSRHGRRLHARGPLLRGTPG
jgi:hypothetical protein